MKPTDFKQLVENQPIECWRVIEEEPIGFCIGFKPNDPSVELDGPFFLMADDGNPESPVWMVNDKIFIQQQKPELQPDNGVPVDYPEPDMDVWRSQDAYNEWFGGE